jgi:ribose-phosphate pyrophosphokinase
VDDLIDTGGTLANTAQTLKSMGAGEVHAMCTHGIFSGSAIKLLEESCLKSVVTLDTIPLPKEKQAPKIIQLSVSYLFAEGIERIYGDKSISTLFDVKNFRHGDNTY